MHNPTSGYTNRRNFLAQTACSAAAVAASGLLGPAAAHAAKPGRWKMRLSTSTVQFSSLSVENACQQIAALGFEGIDFWPMKIFNCPHLDEIQQRLGAEGLKEILAKNRLKLYAFTCYLAGPPGTPDYITGYAKYAELLGKVGGGVAVCSAAAKKGVELRTQVKTLLEQLKPQAELAEKYDSYIAIENHSGGNILLNTVDSFKTFVELNRNPRIGIALAPYHLQAAGISVEEVIRLVGDQILFFYAWQHEKDMKQLPGVGPTDFTPWLAALAEINYRWYVNPFMHGHPGVEEMAQGLATSKQYLEKCYAKAVAT